MAASVNWGSFCGCPSNKSPTVSGSALRHLIFENYHVVDNYASPIVLGCAGDLQGGPINYAQESTGLPLKGGLKASKG